MILRTMLRHLHDYRSIAPTGNNKHQSNQHHRYPDDSSYYGEAEQEPYHHHDGAKDSHLDSPF
jgi:hypothetical protein